MRVAPWLALASLLVSTHAFGQAQPTGRFTPGHALRANTATGSPYSDAGGAAGSPTFNSGYLTEIGITNTGTPFCINDALTSATSGYHQLCFGANSLGGGLISYQALGGAANLGLNLYLNGNLFPLLGIATGNVTGPISPFPTVGDIAVWAGADAIVDSGINIGTSLATAQVALVIANRNYIDGCTLSNDGTTPNSVIDVAACQAVDSSTSTGTLINLAAFTKSTGGPWAAGTGHNGMGTGLTVAPSTWYHVCAIINGGAADVEIDTSATCSNAPAGTTAKRRLGSVKTDSSSHINPFVQVGDEFLWGTPIADLSAVVTGTTTFALSVPTGVKVNALFSGSYTNPNAPPISLVFQSLDTVACVCVNIYTQVVNQPIGLGQVNVRTNTSAQLTATVDAASGTLNIRTYGWIDRRGRDG